MTVAVIGAGVVGMATARAIQRGGHQVVVLDGVDPGRKTSFGNAGFIAIDHVLPLARPSVLKRVPSMLLDRDGPLTVHLPSLFWLLPWMLRFGRAASSAAEVSKGVDSFGALMAEANIAWKAEIQASGLGELSRPRARSTSTRPWPVDGGAQERALQAAKGTAMEIVDSSRAQLAPAVATRVKGVYYPHGMHTRAVPCRDRAGGTVRCRGRRIEGQCRGLRRGD